MVEEEGVTNLSFHEWITHSNFSFLNGASSPDALITRASKLGYQSIALTDLDGVYGLARAYRAVATLKKQGLPTPKLHYGAELHLGPDHDLPMMIRNTLVLIAQTHRGYRHLCQLLTTAHRRGKTTAYLTPDDLSTLPVDDIVAILPMRGRLHQGRLSDWAPQIEQLHAQFNDRFYMAVTRTRHPSEDHGIPLTIETADRLGIPLLISQDAFFHHPQQKRVADVLTAIRLNRTLDEAVPHLWPNSQRALAPIPHILKRYGSLPFLPQALKNSDTLAQSIHFDLSELRYRYPQEWVPNNHTSMSYLTELIWEKAHHHYGDTLPATVITSIKHELDLVQQLDFPDYFLTVFDIVQWARSHSILCQGRGSAANSALCFILGITALDPTKFELLFERFMSLERGDPPDIDVDFEHERREEVIQYIYARYGRHRAAMVCNVISFKSRGAIRTVGQAFGVPTPLLDAAATVLSSRFSDRKTPTEVLTQVKGDFPSALPDHIWQLWGELSDAIRGMPRHLGIHSGGFVISQHPITALSPIEPATMDHRTVIQWSKDDIGALGFFKIDILALGGLTLIQKCLASIKSKENIALTMATIPGDDTATFDMICAADTIGTFQIESRAQMAFLPRHQPRTFYDLVVQVAIIRPGPIQGGMIHPYLRRRRGDEPVTFPDPRLVPILSRTYGVPIFQEQVMRVAIAVGGFSPGEADELRKNIGAFTINLDQNHWIKRLRSGMEKNGIANEFIDTILGHIHGFASYGFPESHAASFALLAYVTAYLKCHYPAHFFMAILNSLPMGFYPADILVKTAQRCGIKVLPICITQSTWDHHLEWVEGHWAIRLGFRLIQGIRKSAAHRIESDPLRHLSATATDPIQRLTQILSRTRLNKLDLSALAAANAFHSIGISRRDALWLAEASPIREILDDLGPAPTLGTEDPMTSVQLDYSATGTSLGLHPAALLRRYAWPFRFPVEWLTFSDTLRSRALKPCKIIVFGMITVRQSPPTAKGVVFLTLWDETGHYDLIIRPEIYQRYRKLIDRQSFLCVRGILQYRENAISVRVDSVVDANEKWTPPIKFPDHPTRIPICVAHKSA